MEISKQELNKLRPLSNYALIKLISFANDKITTKNGVELYIDTTYDPALHVNVVGEVAKAPSKLYYNKKDTEYSLAWDADMEIKEGDTVFMDVVPLCQALGRNNNEADDTIKTDMTVKCGEDTYVFMKYDNLILVKRGDDIIMLNGYILVEAVEEEVINKSNIILPELARKKESCRYGRVAVTGSRVRDYIDYDNCGDNFDVPIGDYIVYDSFRNVEVEYDLHQKLPKKYFRMQRKAISAIIPKELLTHNL